MRIDTVDAFYLSMPEVLDIGDGSQDMLLVRVRAGDLTGWGECEAAPLPTIAGMFCPMSHSACKPVLASVLGREFHDPADIARIVRDVRTASLDLLQADHALSGIEIALWDLLGKAKGEPVFALLGNTSNAPKTPYASALFGDNPQETLEKARRVRERGYRAAKFGWGPFGRSSVAADADQVHAAREGLGTDRVLLVDAGAVWDEDVDAAAARMPSLREADVSWLEEPFAAGAIRSYRALAGLAGPVRLAGGEGSHNPHQAEHLIEYGGVGYIQIDTGRVGGIGDAYRVAQFAEAHDVRYVNHTFTSHLALSASLQPYAGSTGDWLCEYPIEAKALATRLTRTHLTPDQDGLVTAPEGPGLGVNIDTSAVLPYLLDVEMTVEGRTLYRTPELTD